MTNSIEVFTQSLGSEGLHAALRVLNSHTPHRFTGVYRYDGEMLRNVALFDRWNPETTTGPDAPMRETFCALVPAAGGSLAVVDGKVDSRFPWMQANAVICYTGVMIKDEAGQPFGTVCHFDLERCEAGSSQLPLMQRATELIYEKLKG